MSVNIEGASTPWLHRAEKLIQVLANVSVIAGIGFALIQVTESKRSERRRVAIDAVNSTRSTEFIKAYTRIKVTYQSKKIDKPGKPILIDDLNYVINVYDNVAILYLYDVADRCIIKEAALPAVTELSSMLEAFSYPSEYRHNFDPFLRAMSQEDCEGAVSYKRRRKP